MEANDPWSRGEEYLPTDAIQAINDDQDHDTTTSSGRSLTKMLSYFVSTGLNVKMPYFILVRTGQNEPLSR